MDYAIKVCQSKREHDLSGMTLDLIRALYRRDHRVLRVFFYHDAVGLGLDERADAWAGLSREKGFELVLCSQALNERFPGRPPNEAFIVGGLGLWVDACLKADRTLSFGVAHEG